MQILELLIALSGFAVVPSFSARRDQIGHFLLSASVLAALPIGVTIAGTFLALNVSCWTLAPHDPPRTRMGASLFLGTQILILGTKRAVDWILASACFLYFVLVAFGWYSQAFGRGYIRFFNSDKNRV
jgi:hypothetical protein